MSNHNMSIAQFTVSYDGPSLQSHEIDVRDLAPALLGLSDLISLINRRANNNRAEVALKIKTGFQPGSFEVSLEIVQKIFEMKDLLGPMANVTAEEIAKALGVTAAGIGICKGLIELLKIGKGKQPDKVVAKGDHVEIIFGDKTVQTTNFNLSLYADLPTQEAAYKALQPLEKHGIDEIKFKHGDTVTASVSKPEFKSIVNPSTNEAFSSERVENDTVNVTILTLNSPDFKDGNKWKFSDGNSNAVFASIKDTPFLQQVEKNEVKFGAGDMLRVRLRTIQSVTSKGLKNTHEVLEVIEHIPRPRQMSLPI